MSMELSLNYFQSHQCTDFDKPVIMSVFFDLFCKYVKVMMIVQEVMLQRCFNFLIELPF